MRQIHIPTIADAKSATDAVRRRVREWQAERALETLIREHGHRGAIREVSNHRVVHEDMANVAVDEIFSSPSPPMFDQAGNLTRYGYEQLASWQDSPLGEEVRLGNLAHRSVAETGSVDPEWVREHARSKS